MKTRATDPGRTIELRCGPRTLLRLHREADGTAWGRLFTWRDESAAFEPQGNAQAIDLDELLREVCEYLSGSEGEE